jgi:hypothetical protein
VRRDIVLSHDFSSRRGDCVPTAVFWDSREPKVCVVETQKLRGAQPMGLPQRPRYACTGASEQQRADGNKSRAPNQVLLELESDSECVEHLPQFCISVTYVDAKEPRVRLLYHDGVRYSPTRLLPPKQAVWATAGHTGMHVALQSESQQQSRMHRSRESTLLLTVQTRLKQLRGLHK